MFDDEHKGGEGTFCVNSNNSGDPELCVRGTYVRSSTLINWTINMRWTDSPCERSLIEVVA